MKTFILFTIVFFMLSCNNRQEKLRHEILESLTRGDGKIKLGALNGLSWNKMYILGPYSRSEMFDATLMKQQNLIESTGISSRDDILLLMFFNNEILAGYTDIKRSDLDSETSSAKPKRYYDRRQIMIYKKHSRQEGFVINRIN